MIRNHKTSHLFYLENQKIEQNTCVAIIDSTVDYTAVQNFKTKPNTNIQQKCTEALGLTYAKLTPNV